MPGNDSYAKSLLHMNGDNESTIFTDDAIGGEGHTWTANGDAKLSTTSPKFGSACGAFDGAGDFIDTPDSPDFTLGNGNFTIDFWLKKGDTGTFRYVIGQSPTNGANADTSFWLQIESDGRVAAYVCSGNPSYGAISINKITDTDPYLWHHIAIVRNGDTLYLYVDGVQWATKDITGITVNDSSSKLTIGRLGEYAAGVQFKGTIDEFRFSQGIARWTANFTPETGEYVIPPPVDHLVQYRRTRRPGYVAGKIAT